MEPVIIAWTPTNWATVFLMVVGGFLIVKLLAIGVGAAMKARGGANA